MNPSIQTLSRRLPGRRALITGGAGTLGIALATELAFAGWKVGLIDRNGRQLAAVRHDFQIAGLPLWTIEADVRQQAQMDLAVSAYCRHHGGLDLFINNAGVAAGGEFDRVPDAHWQSLWNIHFMGAVHGARAALPHLERQNGILLNVSSAAAILSSPQMGPYNAAKAALVSLSETLAGEYQNRVQVAVALPTFFSSGLLNSLAAPRAAREDAQRLSAESSYTAEQAAIHMLEGLADHRFYILPPGRVRLAWWLKRALPERFLRRLPRRRIARLARLRKQDALLGLLPGTTPSASH